MPPLLSTCLSMHFVSQGQVLHLPMKAITNIVSSKMIYYVKKCTKKFLCIFFLARGNWIDVLWQGGSKECDAVNISKK